MQTIRLLGGASVDALDGAATRRNPAQRTRMALLAVLALSRTRAASRDRLMALLWPESDTDRARHLLRESLYRLRESLAADALVAAGDEVWLDPARIGCDVWEFEAAIERRVWGDADRAYSGPLLDGFFLTEAPEFERLVGNERTRLADMHAQALESLAVDYGTRGDWPGAVALWRRRSAADPLNARVVLHLMEALDAAGDRAAALREATAHTALLESGLGAAQDPAVAAFAEQLRQSPTRRASTNGTADVRTEVDIPRVDAAEVAQSAESQPDVATSVTAVARRPLARRNQAYAGLAVMGVVTVLATGFIRMRARDDAWAE